MKQVKPKDVLQADSLASLEMNKDCILPPSVGPQPCARTEYLDRGRQDADTLNLPTLNMKGQVPLMTYPYDGWWGVNNWTLHKGLNVNLGASVFAAFGKGAPKGAGFAQDLSMMYALPLTKRLTLAIGGWVSNAYWAHDRFTDAAERCRRSWQSICRVFPQSSGMHSISIAYMVWCDDMSCRRRLRLVPWRGLPPLLPEWNSSGQTSRSRHILSVSVPHIAGRPRARSLWWNTPWRETPRHIPSVCRGYLIIFGVSFSF